MSAMRRHPRVLLAAALTLLAAAGAAAYWSATGAGSGRAKLAGAERLRITPGAAAAQLVPGGRANVTIVIHNPNPYPVTVERLTLRRGGDAPDSGFEVDEAHADCDLGALSMAPQSNAGAGWTVPPRVGEQDGELPATLEDALAMAVDAPSSCQGARFTVWLAEPAAEVPAT